MGAVLYQKEGEEWWVLAYCSWTLLPAEKWYPIMEFDAHAVFWVMDHNRHNLFGRLFMVVTDNHLLCYLSHMKGPCNKITRWTMKVQVYDHIIIYKSGKTHLEENCLSYLPQPIQNEKSKCKNDSLIFQLK